MGLQIEIQSVDRIEAPSKPSKIWHYGRRKGTAKYRANWITTSQNRPGGALQTSGMDNRLEWRRSEDKKMVRIKGRNEDRRWKKTERMKIAKMAFLNSEIDPKSEEVKNDIQKSRATSCEVKKEKDINQTGFYVQCDDVCVCITRG